MNEQRHVADPPGGMRVRALAEQVLRIQDPDGKLTYHLVDETVRSWEARAKELGFDVLDYARRRLEAVEEMRSIHEDTEAPEFAHMERLAELEQGREYDEPEGPPTDDDPLGMLPPDLDALVPFREREDWC